MTEVIIRNLIAHGNVVTINGIDRERGQPYAITLGRDNFRRWVKAHPTVTHNSVVQHRFDEFGNQHLEEVQ